MKSPTSCMWVTINGEPWFVAKDVCEALDVYVYGEKTNVTMAVQKLNSDEVYKLLTVDSNRIGLKVRGAYGTTLISESGLYRLVMRSDKPQARAFQDWVTREVLPAIRTVTINGEPWFVAKDVCRVLGLTNPTVATSRLDAEEKAKLNLGYGQPANVVSESGLYGLIMQSRKPEAEDAPKVGAYDALMDADGCITTTDLAHIAGWRSAQAVHHRFPSSDGAGSSSLHWAQI